MAKKKQILYPIVFMVLITAFFTFLLAFINDITLETIENQKELQIQKSIFYVFGIDMSALSDEDIQSQFNELIISETKSGTVYYTYKEDDVIAGYAVEISGKGLWGTITGHVAFDPKHETLLGVNFTAHSETPGLGGRIDEDVYKEQFRSTSLSNLEELFSFSKSTGGNIDAISGATLTSIAVRDIFNLEIPKILELAEKEGFYEAD